MVKCSAPRCSSATYNKTPDITFHKFPNDVNLRNSWLANMNVTNYQPTKSCVLCSKHFDSRNIDKSGFRARLFHGAIPTIFDSLLQENQENLPKPGLTRKRSAIGDIVSVLTKQRTIQKKLEPQPSTSKQNDNISFTIQNIDESEPALATSAKEQPIRTRDLQEEVMKLRSIIKLKNKKIKAISQKNRRLKSKVSKFSDVISDLKKKRSYDDAHILSNIPVSK